MKKLTSADEAKSDMFGTSLSASGNTLMLGAILDNNGTNTGSVYIFQQDQGGSGNWGLLKKITPTGGTPGDMFGGSVAISGDIAVIGAKGDSTNGSNTGAAYIFKRDFGGPGNWGQVKKIFAADAAADDYWFAATVAISGDTVVVGSYYDDDQGANSGSIYMFQQNQGGAENWGQVKKILASDGAASDYFGWSLSLSGDTVVAGAKGDNGVTLYSSGSIYIFQRNNGGTDNWGEIKKNTASDAADYDTFGASVAISGDFIIVGTTGDGDNGASSGSVYIFQKDSGGVGNWGEFKKLHASDGAANDHFGASVSLSGNILAVGANGDDDNGASSGSVYIFNSQEGGNNNWGQVQKIISPDGADYDNFGLSLTVSGDIITVGAPQHDGAFNNTGAAYVFVDSTPSVNLSITDSSLAENSGSVAVTATLSAISVQDVTVSLSFGGTASAGDYLRSDNTITIPAGALNAGIVLTGLDDSIYEADETIFVNIDSVANGKENGTQQVTATITDDDSLPIVSLSLSGSPVAEDGGTALITATQSTLSSLDTTAILNISGSASAEDYNTSNTSIIIPAGSLSANITLTGINDFVHDPYETVILDIATITNASKNGVQQVTVMITDDEPEPTVSLSLSGSPFAENGGISTVTASLSGLSGRDVIVDLSFSGTAADADYTASAHSIIIPAQSSFASITLTGIDDLIIDMDETVVLDIQSLTNAAKDTTVQVTAVITDDDLPFPDFLQHEKIIAIDGQTNDFFGYSVAVSGDTAVIGAYGDDDNGGNAGAAYLFQKKPGVGNTWGLVKKIKPLDGAYGAEFGYSVSISGDTVVVGARSYQNLQQNWTGAAYIFQRNHGAADNWGQVRKLTAADGANWDFFGVSVSILSDTLVVGANRDDDNGADSGSAYIFHKDWGGIDNWGQVKKITASGGAPGDEFGGAVSAGVNTVFIGSEGDAANGSLSGAVYVFNKDSGGITNWGQVSKITPTDSVGGALFGRSIAVDDSILAVGASNKNSVYLFQKDLGGVDNWGQIKKIVATGGALNAAFGQSVSLADSTLLVGAFGDNDKGVNAGAAYVFRSNNGGAGNWGQVGKITASDGVDSDFFGYSVALSGSNAIVGGHNDDDKGVNSGSAYIFTDANSLPTVSLAVTGGNPFAENGGSTTVTVTLSEISNQDVTAFLTFNGTASNSDYSISSDHIVIPAGSLSGSITVSGNDDLTYDPDETVLVDISALISALEKDGFQQITLTITDDETPATVTLSFSDNRFDENSGMTTITATLSGLVGQDVTINLGFSGTASSKDYSLPENFIVIPAGDLSNTVKITGVDDTQVELAESLIVDILSVISAAEDGVQRITAIINDDELAFNNMREFKKILAVDGTENDIFGYSVSIFGEWAAIGAPGYNNSKGAVYIFKKNAGGLSNWGLVKEIIPNNQSQELFGMNIDIGKNFLFVGEPENYTGDISNRHGSVYVYQKNEGGIDNWGWVKTLNPPELVSGDFGNSVSVSGDTAVVGSSYGGITSTIFNIFKQHQGGTNNWGLVKAIIVSDGVASSAEIENDLLVIGDPGNATKGIQAGSVYIFQKDEGGIDNWGQVNKLTASDGTAGDRFGYSVSLAASSVVVGAIGATDNTGAIYIFQKDEGGLDNWGQVKKITSDDGITADNFGTSVALMNNILIAGSPGHGNGSAYVFQRYTGGDNNWGQVAKFTASDGAAADNLGISVDISSETILVGASSNDDNGNSSGSAYFYSFNAPGDFDHDGAISLSDIIMALDVLTGGNSIIGTNGDINGDGKIGIADIVYFMRKVATTP